MSGHSKWHSIRHQKGIKDQRRGKLFTKLASAVTIAARESGADPETNFKLRLAIDKARAANMPKENIERAVMRAKPGAGEGLVEATYEGFGPEGIAVLVRVLTDNKNRTISAVRNTFTSFGGKLSGSGSVTHQFIQRGVITLSGNDLDSLELLAIDLGALDTQRDKGRLTLFCQPQELHKIKKELESKGAVVEDADFSFEPQTPICIKEKDKAKKILQFMDALEEIDEVVKSWANFDIENEILKEIA